MRAASKMNRALISSVHPELATTAEHALTFALCEWDATFLALSDRNDIRGVTKRLNGGYNGYDDRVKWFNKVWSLIGSGDAWQAAANDDSAATLQTKLNALGYGLKADGRYGPKTEAAVRDFQAKAGVKVDGIAGAVTLAVLDARLATAKMPKRPDHGRSQLSPATGRRRSPHVPLPRMQ